MCVGFEQKHRKIIAQNEEAFSIILSSSRHRSKRLLDIKKFLAVFLENISRQIEKTFHVHFLKLQIYKFIHHFQQSCDASVIDDEKWFVVRNRKVNFGGFHQLGKQSIYPDSRTPSCGQISFLCLEQLPISPPTTSPAVYVTHESPLAMVVVVSLQSFRSFLS